ncbi:MAG: hypothetical protein ACI4C3_01075 [Bacteroides sp.]
MSLLTSCVSNIEPQEDEGEVARLRASAYVVSELTRTSLTDGAKQLTWLVLNSGNEIVVNENQSSEASGFGTLMAELPYGAYQLFVVAHGQSSPCSVNLNGVATFSETKLTDTFCKARSFTLEKGGKDTLQIDMPRCVARFSIKCTDAIPVNAATM